MLMLVRDGFRLNHACTSRSETTSIHPFISYHQLIASPSYSCLHLLLLGSQTQAARQRFTQMMPRHLCPPLMCCLRCEVIRQHASHMLCVVLAVYLACLMWSLLPYNSHVSCVITPIESGLMLHLGPVRHGVELLYTVSTFYRKCALFIFSQSIWSHNNDFGYQDYIMKPGYLDGSREDISHASLFSHHQGWKLTWLTRWKVLRSIPNVRSLLLDILKQDAS